MPTPTPINDFSKLYNPHSLLPLLVTKKKICLTPKKKVSRRK